MDTAIRKWPVSEMVEFGASMYSTDSKMFNFKF